MIHPEGVTAWQAERIDEFLRASDGFRYVMIPVLSVLALRGPERNFVVSSRLTFTSPTSNIEEKSFQSWTLRAVTRRLADIKTGEAIISAIAAGSFEIDSELYEFPRRQDDGLSVTTDLFHQAFGPQSRMGVLTFRGRELGDVLDAQRLEWELRASDPPYLSFNELLFDFGLSEPAGNAIFESILSPPVAIDRENSRLDGTNATIKIIAEKGLPTDKIRLSLVAIRTGEPAFRQTMVGADLAWSAEGQFQVATFECEIPQGRTLQAIAILNDMAFHYWWIIDPMHIANPRKGVFEVADNGLSLLREFLVPSSKGGARELESAVAWLFWLLGFSVAHLGSTTRTSDAVDILVTTPSGNIALVECTTGVISADKKMANLLARRAAVVERLAQSNHNTLKVMPILVTSLGKPEVEHELAQSREKGVLVLTREDLFEMLDQVDLMIDPDQLYMRAEEELKQQQAVPEPNLPGL